MASVITTDERKAEIREKIREAGLADWFRCEPGFRFLDSDGAECIVIGWGGWRSDDPLGSLSLHPKTPLTKGSGLEDRHSFALYTLVFKPATLVGAYLYKGEHHLISIPDMEELNKCLPLTTEATTY